MRALLFAGLFSCIPGFSIAQKSLYKPGYIVRASASADTVRGYINTFYAVRKKGIISFTSTLDSARYARTFRPVDLSAAGAGTQEAYVVRLLPIQDTLQPRFIQAVILGNASLYKTDANEQSATYFIEKNPAQLMPLRRGQYTQILRLVLTNCAELTFQDKEVSTTYSQTAFQNTVLQYNQCVAPGATSRVLQGPPRPRMHLGLRVGFQHGRIYYPDMQKEFLSSAQWQPVAGLYLQFPITAGLSLIPEVAYGSLRSSASRTGLVDASTDVRQIETRFDASYIQFPITARYTFRQSGRVFRPYTEAGYILGRALSANAYYIQRSIPPTTPSFVYTTQYPVEKKVSGFHYGAGVEMLSKIGLWGLSLRVERTSLNANGLFNYLYLDSNHFTLTYSWR